MGRELVIATNNLKKFREMHALLQVLEQDGITIKSLRDFPPYPEPEEDGDDYITNALIKARAAVAHTGRVCIADDSGLEVEYLGGKPGVHSKRFAGEETPWEVKIATLLRLLEGVPEAQRKARFNSVVAISTPWDAEYILRDTCQGWIYWEPRGEHGFGYDPIFYLPELGCTMAELPMERKNQISHRAKTLSAAIPLLRWIFRQ
ncbi:MAG: RdgB/HAM1 family non-canonical purine NTP pyrophosphatase [Armatimonadota bacterium]|nr:RdgB/HAM1 family non-canonical purine NTP pyrophosphatase [bacterium]MCS7308889.1 RdgB/HAM1 family non-canonical purine NTP pyrophosphatase [Armatimonadota bacterium]MDW8103527.1 RdgB/HAM1 family non-canonical purine NTP pyrophosphatase [Armatimonadota bacterium]MDW8289491.1 RdgB/HAM1 family non-canonical purine NTP pyrophosphatase [Armatimonadota bacterium]